MRVLQRHLLRARGLRWIFYESGKRISLSSSVSELFLISDRIVCGIRCTDLHS